MIGDRKVDIPSYIVTLEEEKNIHFSPESNIPSMLESTKPESSPEVKSDIDTVKEESEDAIESSSTKQL
jgi:small subunit ribosomal protein S4